jgi:RimJ/RimL family protein N-acetyltransferase
MAMNHVRLETERLLLREFHEEEWKAVVRINAPPEAQRYLLSGTAGEEESREFVMNSLAHVGTAPRHHFGLAIVLNERGHKERGRLIGFGAVGRTSWASSEAKIGWGLDQAFWGHGYATEAMREMMALGFESGGFDPISAYCFAANSSSRRVMAKLGMRLQSRQVWRQWLLALGHLEGRPIVHYSISRDEWALARRTHWSADAK